MHMKIFIILSLVAQYFIFSCLSSRSQETRYKFSSRVEQQKQRKEEKQKRRKGSKEIAWNEHVKT